MKLQMELTNKCNLKCVECPNRLMKRERADMPKDVFEAILNNYIKTDNFGTIIPHKDGESLLHPHIKTIIEDISKVSDAKIDIYTNGIPLKKDFVYFLTSINNPVWLLISFHFYSHTGKKYDYSKVFDELETIIRMDHKNVELVFASHLTDFAEEWELKRWQEYWSQFVSGDGMLRAVHINTAINPWTGLIKQSNCIKFDACPYADGQHLFIGNTGNVIACCMDLEEEVVFGNVLEGDKERIMSKREDFYKILRNKEIPAGVCERCLA